MYSQFAFTKASPKLKIDVWIVKCHK
jgi:hypothetical protein